MSFEFKGDAIESPLIPLYTPWIKEILDQPLPQETQATCNQCAMCPQKDEPFAGFAFNPNTKCCSFHPKLPNYLIGSLLTDKNAGVKVGQEKVRAAIASGQATPFGLEPNADYSLRYEHHEFGRNQEMLCPYFVLETGHCGVWQNRPATCQTWYCKSDRGKLGNDFWLALNSVLNKIEVCLADWCLLQLELPNARPPVERLDKIDLTRFPEYHWGKWADDKEGFYIRCAELVGALSWQQVAEIGGASLALMVSFLHHTYAVLGNKKLPSALFTGSFNLSGINAEQVNLTTYSPYDPISLPLRMFNLLHYFDGSSFEEIHQRILQEEELDIPQELVQSLIDFAILREKPSLDP